MGDSADGSTAAQGALDRETGSEAEGHSNSPRGFLGRILNVLGGGEVPEPSGEETPARPEARALPGLSALRRLRVDDIATPKPEIAAAPVDIGLDDLVAVFREHGFSRLPVYDGTIDTPLGIIHLKDLALGFGFGAPGEGFELRPLLRPLLYVPPSMALATLLQKMQAERIHMALVIDEYGSVDGLVTIEDLIETVIGDIDDEHDEDEEGAFWSQEKPGQWVVLARAPLDEFEEAVGRRLADDEEGEEVDTMGGLVFMLTGRVPLRGERVLAENGVEFEVLDADPRRIKRLRVRLPEARA